MITGKLLVKWLVYTTMAFIISNFIHFILNFRDLYRNYYSMLVVLSTIKLKLSLVYDHAFLLQDQFFISTSGQAYTLCLNAIIYFLLFYTLLKILILMRRKCVQENHNFAACVLVSVIRFFVCTKVGVWLLQNTIEQ